MNKRLAEIEARKVEIRTAMDAKDTNLNLDEIETELKALSNEETEIRKQENIASMLNHTEIREDVHTDMEQNIFESMEYRKAFMDYVLNGTMKEEYRSVAMTDDNGAVIPVAVLNQIIEQLDSVGDILPLVHRIVYPAGVIVPTSVLKPVAKWVNEGAAAETQDKKTDKIVFGAYELVAEVGVSFKAKVQSLSAFESTIIANIAEAMTKALEQAIVSGTGVGQPKGIITETVPAKRRIALSSKLSFTDIKNIVKAIPSAYKTNAVIVMNESTFYDFEGITDTNGQPIAHVNYGVDGAPVYALMGKKVVTCDYLTDLDSAKAGEVVAFAMQLDKYVLNTAYDMDLVEYDDKPTRNHMYQSMMLVDGKVADNNGLVLIAKASA